ncbi:hypothetical protein Tco_1180688, partial [Tanacetum coccineum]
MSSLDKSSTAISDLYKSLDVITQLLKDITNAVKDDPTTNRKIKEATETFAKISSQNTEIISLVKDFDFSTLHSSVKNLQEHALKQEEASAAWTISSLRQNISEIKSMMTEIYQAFKDQSYSAPSAQPIVSITPESPQAALRTYKRKGIATESNEDPSKKLVTASTIVRLDLDKEVKVLYMINGKRYYLTGKEMQAYLDKEELIKKAEEEARLLAISKPKVIKVVQEKAEKIRLDPKKIASAKAGEKFKKAQGAEHQVLKREHSKKIKRLTELNKRRAKQYMNNDVRNFEAHDPFRFLEFGVTELDVLGLIIQKKKNSIVKELMISLSKRYERLKKIPEELGIQPALPAPVLEQASSQTSRRKRKHMELEPEVKVHGLECNRSLTEGVPFVNNMVIEEPEYRIFFTDV